MKTIKLLFGLLIITLFAKSQNISYQIHPAYHKSVKKANLININLISELTPDYPVNWIKDYQSTQISVIRDGITFQETNKSDILSDAQKNVLKSADIGDDISITVKYKTNNSATGNPQINSMNFTMNVIPEVEAQYPGGELEMLKYFRKHELADLPAFTSLYYKQELNGLLRFTINEKGEIINPIIKNSFGSDKIDKLLIDVLNKMPNWKPAENGHGEKVKQDFEFVVGNVGC